MPHWRELLHDAYKSNLKHKDGWRSHQCVCTYLIDVRVGRIYWATSNKKAAQRPHDEHERLLPPNTYHFFCVLLWPVFKSCAIHVLCKCAQARLISMCCMCFVQVRCESRVLHVLCWSSVRKLCVACVVFKFGAICVFCMCRVQVRCPNEAASTKRVCDLWQPKRQRYVELVTGAPGVCESNFFYN